MEFTEQELKEGLNFMKMKDFWLVSGDGTDYYDLLQAILDHYYNDYPNTYSADIFEHQNSSRIIVRCNVCNGAQLSSYDPFISHNKGKQHKKNLVERQNARDFTGVDRPVIVFKRPEDTEHNFDKGSLEYELFKTTHGVIGYQFLYSELVKSERLFTCQLCSKAPKDDYNRMKQLRALRHMQSKKHQNKYLKAKFDISDRTLHDEDSRQNFIADVVKKEGKLLYNILTLEVPDSDDGASSSKDIKDSDDKCAISSSLPGASSSGADVDKVKVINDPKDPETAEEFLETIHSHLLHMIKNNRGDNITKELETDSEALDLLITTANVLSQKIYIFGMDYDSTFKEQGKKLLEKCENLLFPIRGEEDRR